MNLPRELQPTAEIDIPLPSGGVARLPSCRPVFRRWSGSPVFDFGRKPILDHNGEPCFAELVILRMLIGHGWNGAWVSAFGGTHFLRSMPKSRSLESEAIPADKEAILKTIWRTAKTTACPDVFVWQGSDILFCEAKAKLRRKDKLTNGQVRFIEGPLTMGISPESLLIVEWTDR